MGRISVITCSTLLLLLIGLVSGQPWFDPEEFVQLETGSILGMLYPKTRAFRGVPYAAPPVGKNGRWKAPSPVQSWGPDPLGTRDYKPGCVQNCVDGKGLPPHACPQLISEDCLYLNVYTPRGVNENSNLPVLVWFPGGNYDKGMANLLYEGGFVAEQKNVIVVTVTYRVGALGFLVAPGLNGGEVTNLGILDQRQALMWVQKNIRAFGGSPDNVTIFGQSAGGRSVSIHVVSPLSANLFHQAIIMSDPMHIVLSTHDEALALGERFGAAVGCNMNDTDCLYLLDAEEIIHGQEEAIKFVDMSKPISAFMQLLPSVDGVDIPDQPLRMMAEGNFQPKPIMQGVVSEEAVLYIHLGWSEPVDALTYRALILAIFKDNGTDVLNMYPPDNTSPDQRPQMELVGTHITFHCPNRWNIRNLAQTTDSYFYLFDHFWSFDGWGENFSFCNQRVCHGVDMPILFNTAQVMFDITQEEEVLSHNFIDYIGNFATTGDPNNGTPAPAVLWPKYNTQQDQLLRIASDITIEQEYLKANCDMFDTIGYDPMKVERILFRGILTNEEREFVESYKRLH